MLVLQRSDQESYNLFTKGEHLIGRQGDLKLSEDQSISRQHAVIRVTVKDGRTKLTLEDLGSKTGTYVNDSPSRIGHGTTVVLKVGDKIKFGTVRNVWTVMEKPLVVCASKLSPENKLTLKRQLLAVKGSIVTDWSDECTHLTMNQFGVTIKAVCALALAKPIVTLAYWENLADVFEKNRDTPLPRCDDFCPEATGDYMRVPGSSITLDFSRKNLFDGLKFVVFGDEEVETLWKTVEAAGGQIINGFNDTVSAEEIRSRKTILVQPKTATTNRSLSNIRKVLNANHLRAINDSEIYISIICRSCDKYCNPAFDIASLLQRSESQMPDDETNAVVLAAETQDTPMTARYSETNSGNFSLTINGGMDSENEIVSDTEPMIVNDSNDEEEIGISRVAVKRKHETKDTSLPKAKSRKIDDWFVKSSQRTDIDSNSTTAIISSDSSRSKKTETLFGSMHPRKTTSNSSNSIFTTSEQKSLFNFGIKRKGTDTTDGTPPLKRSCPLTLKLEPEIRDSQEGPIVLSDSSSMDSFANKLRGAKLSDEPCSQVNVPTTISLSQFIDVKAQANGCDRIKEEPNVNAAESTLSQAARQPVVNVASLIKFSTPPESTHEAYTNNFKKFRKSQVCYPTRG